MGRGGRKPARKPTCSRSIVVVQQRWRPREGEESRRGRRRKARRGKAKRRGGLEKRKRRHRRRGGRDEDEASRTEQQSATRQASAIPGEHDLVRWPRARTKGVPGKRRREGKEGWEERVARLDPGSSGAGRFSKEEEREASEPRGRSNRLAEPGVRKGGVCVCEVVLVPVPPRSRRNSTLIAAIQRVTTRPTKLANTLERRHGVGEEDGGGYA